MNNILVLLLMLFIAFISDAQSDVSLELVGKKFKTDVVVGAADYGWTPKLQSVKLSEAGIDPWGYFLQINADGTFLAYNQNSCGNDCRVKVSGTYKMENGIIEFTSNTIRFFDICAGRPRQEVDASIGSFAVEEKDGEIRLVKVPNEK